jgi:hypothetical protein
MHGLAYSKQFYCPLNHFGVFSYEGSSTFNPMQDFLSRVYSGPVDQRFSTGGTRTLRGTREKCGGYVKTTKMSEFLFSVLQLFIIFIPSRNCTARPAACMLSIGNSWSKS